MRTLISSPGGKMGVSKKIIKYFPEHKTYVEAFAGSAAIFFVKKPSTKEVLNDLDDYSFCLKYLRDANDATIAELKRFNWNQSRELFDKFKAMTPTTPMERFRKFVYLTRWSYSGTSVRTYYKNATNPGNFNLEKFTVIRDRLKGVDILSEDYKLVLTKYDAADTFFYLDPPYHDDWVKGFGKGVGFNLKEFVDAIAALKGKFIISYSLTAENLKSFGGHGWTIQRLKFLRTTTNASSAKFRAVDYEILVFNFKPAENTLYLYDEEAYAYSEEDNFPIEMEEITEGVDNNMKNDSGNFVVTLKEFKPESASDQEILDEYEQIKKLWTDGKFVEGDKEVVKQKFVEILYQLLKRETTVPDWYDTGATDLFTESIKKLVESGLYLVSPHAEKLANGEKTLVVKAREYSNMSGKLLFFGDNKRIYGVLKLK